MLGLEEFSEDAFKEHVDFISARGLTHLTFHLKDGTAAEREYEFRKEGIPWTDERREKQTKAIPDSLAPERSRKTSENTKRTRSEKHWDSKRK
nr:MAG TPA: hypothetical protein [Caudoviricetes sp.]